MQAIKKLSLALVCVAGLGVGTAMAADGMNAAAPLEAVQADPQVMRAPVRILRAAKLLLLMMVYTSLRARAVAHRWRQLLTVIPT